MNIFLLPLTPYLAVSEGAGGLFDFNATLPLMAIQFVILTIVLTFVFYKPITTVLEDRETGINTNLKDAADKLLKADGLYTEYEVQLKEARNNALTLIADAEKEAKELVAEEIAQARNESAKLILQTNKDLEVQKSLALQKLETQVDELSILIKEKLIGKQATL